MAHAVRSDRRGLAKSFLAPRLDASPVGSRGPVARDKPAGLEYSVATPVGCPTLNASRRRFSEASSVYVSPTVPCLTPWARPMGRGIGIRSTEKHREFFVRELESQEARSFLEGTIFDLMP